MSNPVLLDECTEYHRILQRRPGWRVHGTALIAAALVLGSFVWMHFTQADLVVKAEGRTRPIGNTQPVKARFAGRVVRVHFKEGDFLVKGAVLAELDTERLDTDIRKREGAIRAGLEDLKRNQELQDTMERRFQAELATDAAKMKSAKDEYKTAERRRAIDLTQIDHELAQATRDRDRLDVLFRQSTGSLTDLEKAKALIVDAEIKRSKAMLPTDANRLLVMEKELAFACEQHREKMKEWEQKHRIKESEVEGIRRDLETLVWERDQATIRMPIDGIVTTGELRDGELVQAGQELLQIAARRGMLYEVKVRTEDVAAIRVGMPVRIKLDAFDFQQFGTVAGRVCQIAPDSQTSGNAPPHYLVRIELDQELVGQDGLTGQIKLGMTGHAEIVTEHQNLLTLLTRKIRQTIRLG